MTAFTLLVFGSATRVDICTKANIMGISIRITLPSGVNTCDDMVPQLQGAHEIQTYCLGHTAFVTAVSFVQANGATAIVTASGDGSVRSASHSSSQ